MKQHELHTLLKSTLEHLESDLGFDRKLLGKYWQILNTELSASPALESRTSDANTSEQEVLTTQSIKDLASFLFLTPNELSQLLLQKSEERKSLNAQYKTLKEKHRQATALLDEVSDAMSEVVSTYTEARCNYHLSNCLLTNIELLETIESATTKDITSSKKAGKLSKFFDTKSYRIKEKVLILDSYVSEIANLEGSFFEKPIEMRVRTELIRLEAKKQMDHFETIVRKFSRTKLSALSATERLQSISDKIDGLTNSNVIKTLIIDTISNSHQRR